MIKRLNELILILIPACTICGVFYNAAYFSLLDWHLITILDTNDYIVSTVLFIPFVAAYALLYSWQVTIPLRYPAKTSGNRPRAWVRYLFWPVILLILLIAFMIADSSNFFVVTILMAYIVNNMLGDLGVFRGAPEWGLPATIFIFAALVSASIGFLGAHADLSAIQTSHSVKVKNIDISMNVRLCRALSKGIIVKDLAGPYIAFLPWDDVEKISRVSTTVGDKTRACGWLGLMCF